jgi:hypothetical protein
MPIRVSCPSCGTNLAAPDAAAGRTVKCPKCATPFAVPAAAGEAPPAAVSATPAPARRPAPPPPPEQEYYEDQEPGYRRQPPRGGPGAPGEGTGLPMGLGIASLSLGACALVVAWIPCVGALSWPVSALGLVLGAVGLVIAFTRQGRGIAFPIAGTATSFVALGLALYWVFWWNRAASDLQQAGERFKKDVEALAKQQQQFNNPANLPPVQEGGELKLNNGTASVTGNLTDADPRDKMHKQSPSKVYTVNLNAGKMYQIDMESQQVDPFLVLQKASGEMVAANDDVGFGNLNSRINYQCTQAGQYRIVATCLWPAPPGRNKTGTFTLKVQEK